MRLSLLRPSLIYLPLSSLKKPTISFASLKRKQWEILCSVVHHADDSCSEHPSPVKKTKKQKQQLHQHQYTSSGSTTDFNNQAALERRAQRFQREHQIAAQKTNGFHPSTSYLSRSASPYVGDETLADPVRPPYAPTAWVVLTFSSECH